MIASIQNITNVVERSEKVRVLDYINETVQHYDEIDFLMHFRLRRTVANDLIGKFRTSGIYKSLNSISGKPPLSPEMHILAFLWFAGHRACYRDVADRFNVTLSSLHEIITRVLDFLVSIAPEHIKLPNDDEKKEISAFFKRENKFPKVIGAMDGTHISINKPKEDPDSYYTRKKQFAIHAQALVNHKRKFMDVFVGYPASVHDARVFRESDLYPLVGNLCNSK